MKNPFELSNMHEHSFVKKALSGAVQVQKALGDKNPAALEASYERDPNEYEFFLMRVGKCLADLLTCCEHLSHIPLYLSSYRETLAMKKAGINRSKYIVLHIEGYLIRVAGIKDRCLQLIDAVFHLLNDYRRISEQVILNNIKVDRTEIPKRMKVLSQLVQEYAPDRNKVVHQGSYTDQKIRILEMYCIVKNSRDLSAAEDGDDLSGLIKEMATDIVKQKQREFKSFNGKLYGALTPLLSAL